MHGGVDVAHHGALGDLDDQVRRIEAALGEKDSHRAVDAGFDHVPGRQVDADGGVVSDQSRLLPPQDLTTGLRQHETVDGTHEPGLLGELYERGRTEKPAGGMRHRTKASIR